MDATIESIPKFIRPLPKRQKTERQKHFEMVQARKKKEAEAAMSVVKSGIDYSKALKQLVIELRQQKLTYKWISEITGATYGYVRNICWQCGLTNDAIGRE